MDGKEDMKKAIEEYRKKEFAIPNKSSDDSNENKEQKSTENKVNKEPLFPVENPALSAQVQGTDNTVTDNTDDTDNTDNTDNTIANKYLSRLSVLCDNEFFSSVFGDETIERILKALALENRYFRPCTYQNLGDSLGKDQANIRQAISRKKAFFVTNKPDGRKSVTVLSQLAVDEIERRIKMKDAEKVRIIHDEQKVGDAKIEQEEWLAEVSKVAVEMEVERDGQTLILDFNKLVEFDPHIADIILDRPEEFIEPYLNFKLTSEKGDYRLVIINLPDSCKSTIEDLRHSHINKLSIVEGRVAAISEVRPQCTEAKFECPSCGTIISVLQIEKKFREPNRCSCGRKGQFRLMRKTMVDAARIIIEDLQEKTDNPYKKRFNCFIQGDLTHREKIKVFAPGNEVKVTGILKEVPIPLASGSISTRFDYVFDLLDGELSEQEVIIEKFSKEEAQQIKEVAAEVDEKGFGVLTSSFAPDIEGQEYIKKAIMCQLCNARNQGIKDRNKPNILLIGDPSMAKSVVSKFAIGITPGSQKAVGGSTTAVGITASIQKEDAELGGWRVEPGALVNAKDLLFIDELNNLSDEDKPRLQEGLSEQTVTINKANIHTSMKVSAGVIAAANPIHGHFNTSVDVTQQFNIPSPILNRFDTIFVIRDEVEASTDRKIAKKMLQRTRDKIKPTYDEEFLRKFFVYVKQQPEPEIDEKMEDHLADLYVEIRQGRGDKLIINARFVESITRLLKASAKMRLSEKIEDKDIERALDILKHSHYATSEYDYFREHLGVSPLSEKPKDAGKEGVSE